MSSPASSAVSVRTPGGEFTGRQWGPGDGRTVLLLHGFPQRCQSWSLVAARLAEAGLHAVALDQRGYSPGVRPADVADYALPRLIGDVIAIVEALGSPIDLAGHDWGAVVGWQVAARHPELVRTWTAVSTPNQLALNEVLAVDAEQRARFGYILAFREVGRAEATLLANDGAALRAIYGDAVARDRVDADLEFFAQPGVLSAALNWYRAMSPSDVDGLPRVTVPTSYVWGSEDIAFGRPAAERTGDYVDAPYAFVPLDGVSHWVPDEAADALAEVIVERVLAE